MSNELVTVPQGDNPSDTAVLLLAAAESEGFGPGVVRTDTQGSTQKFLVPKNVAQVALGEDAEGVEDYEDPWENVRSGEVVTDYPQQGAEASIGGDESEGETPYADRLKADLEAEVEKRNADRSEDNLIEVGGKGNKPDLVAALEADDAKSADTPEQADEQADPEAASPEQADTEKSDK